MIQVAAGGLVGAVADRVVTVLVGMFVSLVVGVLMEWVKLYFRRKSNTQNPPDKSPNSGSYCASQSVQKLKVPEASDDE